MEPRLPIRSPETSAIAWRIRRWSGARVGPDHSLHVPRAGCGQGERSQRQEVRAFTHRPARGRAKSAGNVAVLGASERRELAVLFPEGRHFLTDVGAGIRAFTDRWDLRLRRLLTHKRAPIFPQPGLKNGVTQLRSSPSQLPAPACPGDRLRARRCSLWREDGHGNTDQQPAEGARHSQTRRNWRRWCRRRCHRAWRRRIRTRP